MAPVTVYLPGVSATNAPASSTWATPEGDIALTAQRTSRSASALPLASWARDLRRTTSPVFTVLSVGSSVSRATVLGTIRSLSLETAAPLLAVIVASPGASSNQSAIGTDVGDAGRARRKAHRVGPTVALCAVGSAGQGQTGTRPSEWTAPDEPRSGSRAEAARG